MSEEEEIEIHSMTINQHVYAIIRVDREDICFESEMLKNADVPGLLYVRVIENVGEYEEIRYDISNLQSVASVVSQEKFSYVAIVSMLRSIEKILNGLQEHLLSEDGILLLPEWMFMEYGKRDVYVCYAPSKEHRNAFCSSFQNLAKFIMDNVDYEDEQAVELVFEIDKIVHMENWNFSGVCALIREDKQKQQEGERNRDIQNFEREEQSQKEQTADWKDIYFEGDIFKWVRGRLHKFFRKEQRM